MQCNKIWTTNCTGVLAQQCNWNAGSWNSKNVILRFNDAIIYKVCVCILNSWRAKPVHIAGFILLSGPTFYRNCSWHFFLVRTCWHFADIFVALLVSPKWNFWPLRLFAAKLPLSVITYSYEFCCVGILFSWMQIQTRFYLLLLFCDISRNSYFVTDKHFSQVET